LTRPCKYPWDRLRQRGDHVLVDTPLSARSIGVSASTFVRANLGRSAVVRATQTPEGVVVFLAYAPPVDLPHPVEDTEEPTVEAPDQPEVVEDDADTQESEDE
jgi:hypothetical protein